MARILALLWDNFGPLHEDRVRAVAATFRDRKVVGIELCSKSDTYEWVGFEDLGYEKQTLFPDRDLSQLNACTLFLRLIITAQKLGRGDYVLCHWNLPAIFLFAHWLRMTGSRVYTMGCSKFDDKPRDAKREALKSLILRPYHGAIASGHRSIDYFRFLGIPAERIVGEYNTVSIGRIKKLTGTEPAPNGVIFESRGFLSVARLVPKKNLGMLLHAYARYRETTTATPRPLTLCGSGPEEAALRALAEALGLTGHVRFMGFVQTEVVCRELGKALALLLPSMEEQFGNVVPEAQAAGLPVIISDNAGARDLLLRTGVNGFVVESDNPEGLAYFMRILAEDENLWSRMAKAASEAAKGGDVAEFCRAISKLIGAPAIGLPVQPRVPPRGALESDGHIA